MATTREQKIEALSDFLENRASAHPRGHSFLDGIGCPDHDKAFGEVAEELLKLIEDENYGYEENTSIQG